MVLAYVEIFTCTCLFQRLENRVKAGKVDCDRFAELCQRVGINGYPTVRYYPGVKGTSRQVI